MTTATFNIVGTSNLNGTTKVRWANDLVTRFKMLHKGGHLDIELFELPEAMTKLDGLKYMANDRMFASAEDQAIIADTIADKEKQSGKGYKVNLSLDAILERGKAQQVADNAVLESVLNAVVS